MRFLTLALLIAFSINVHGQIKLAGKYKLVAIQNKTANTIDSTMGERGLTINFETDSTVDIFLSRNHCMGPYQILKDEVNLKNAGACTEVCCDSKLALKFRSALLDINKFLVKEDELVLENNTWILSLKTSP